MIIFHGRGRKAYTLSGYRLFGLKHTSKTALPILVQYTHNSQTHQCGFHCAPSFFPAFKRKVYIPSARVTTLCCGFNGLRAQFGFHVIRTKQYVFMIERDSVEEAAFSVKLLIC